MKDFAESSDFPLLRDFLALTKQIVLFIYKKYTIAPGHLLPFKNTIDTQHKVNYN